MKAEDSQLLWKYIDGACSAEEQQLIEKKLKEDSSFKKEWMERGLMLNSV